MPHLPDFIVGTYTGTGTDGHYLCIGFVPSFIIILSSTEAAVSWWHYGFGDDDIFSAIDSGVGATDIALAGSGGVTAYRGGNASDGAEYEDGQGNLIASGTITGEGFIVGDAAAINTDDSIYKFIAFRGLPDDS